MYIENMSISASITWNARDGGMLIPITGNVLMSIIASLMHASRLSASTMRVSFRVWSSNALRRERTFVNPCHICTKKRL